VNNFTGNIGHMAMAGLTIIAVTVLALHNTISGDTAVAIIAGIGGVSVGGGVASASVGVPVSNSGAGLAQTGTYTLVPTTSVTVTKGPSEAGVTTTSTAATP